MTDRISGLYVTLSKDYRDDDAEAIISAIKMVKGVLDVESNIVEANDYYSRTRINSELKQKLYEFINTNL